MKSSQIKGWIGEKKKKSKKTVSLIPALQKMGNKKIKVYFPIVHHSIKYS